MDTEKDSLRQIAADVRDQLALRVDVERPDAQTYLALVRAARELVPLLSDGEHAEAIVREWLMALDPGAAALRWRPAAVPSTAPSLGWAAALASSNHVAPGVFYLAVFQLLAPGVHDASGRDYLAALASELGVNPELLRILQGWFLNQADGAMRTAAAQYLGELCRASDLSATLFKQIERSTTPYHVSRMLPSERWETAQARIREWVAELGAAVSEFGFQSGDVPALEHLRRYLENDRFRLAVLGEFKRGKSTLINAITGIPDLLPADVLPSTSGLIELRYGEALRFEVNEKGPLAAFRDVTEAEFRRDAGDAHKRHTNAEAKATQSTAPVARWRLHVPSEYLREHEIDLIDTPGLGEDYGRDAIAHSEAQLADAAILVLSARQLATIKELELLQSMKAKAKNIIIAVNSSDGLGASDQERVLAFARSRIGDITDAIPPEHVLMVSALSAVEALKAGRRDDEWYQSVVRLTQLARKNILRDAAPLRVHIVARRIDQVTREVSGKLAAFVETQRTFLSDLEGRQAAADQAAVEHRHAEEAIRAAQQMIRNGAADCAVALARTFAEDLPAILEEVARSKDNWTSSESVVTSPTKYAKEIAAAAQREIGERVRAWLEQRGQTMLLERLQRALDDAALALAPLRDYLATAMPGRDFDGTMRQLWEKSLQLALGVDASDHAVKGIAQAGVIAALGGYVIADVLLYYMLGIISGFFNPLLLLAAVAIGGLILITGGRAKVEATVKEKIFGALSKQLTSDETREQTERLLWESVKAIFDRVADNFQLSAMSVVNEADAQLRLARRDVEEAVKRYGRDRAGFDRYLSELELRRAKANVVFERMRSEVDDLRASIEAPLPPPAAAAAE